MRNVNVGVYEFSELSKDVQEDVIERYRARLMVDSINKLNKNNPFYDKPIVNDNLGDIMNRELNRYTDNLDFELRYSLNCCQGDGVSFDGIVEGKEELLTLASLVYDNKIPKRHTIKVYKR